MINFTELYDTTIDNLFAFGMKYTSDRELVKDCIQDVFVKFYTKRDYISVTANNVESYLYASLRNRLHDEFRHNSHLCDGEISDDSNASLLKDAEVFDLERMEDESSKINTVVRFLKCLSPRQQQIITLYYMEERKYDDICRIMGINYQSVRNLMHRSLLRLRFLATQSQARQQGVAV